MRKLDKYLEIDDTDIKEIIRTIHFEGMSPREAVVKYLTKYDIIPTDQVQKVIMPNNQVVRI
jgi:hypothetical protein